MESDPPNYLNTFSHQRMCTRINPWHLETETYIHTHAPKYSRHFNPLITTYRVWFNPVENTLGVLQERATEDIQQRTVYHHTSEKNQKCTSWGYSFAHSVLVTLGKKELLRILPYSTVVISVYCNHVYQSYESSSNQARVCQHGKE